MRKWQPFAPGAPGMVSGAVQGHETCRSDETHLRVRYCGGEFLQDPPRYPGRTTNPDAAGRLWDLGSCKLSCCVPGQISCRIHRQDRHLLRRGRRITHVAADVRGCRAVEPSCGDDTGGRGGTTQEDIHCIAAHGETARPALEQNLQSALFLLQQSSFRQ